jgi:hypothetical protein
MMLLKDETVQVTEKNKNDRLRFKTRHRAQQPFLPAFPPPHCWLFRAICKLCREEINDVPGEKETSFRFD